MKAVVLAAGEGVRLRPLTATKPKHMIKLAGKPILEHCVNSLRNAGIGEMIIVVHYRADAVRAYFEDGKKHGLKIEYVEQKEMLGTGNAVGSVESYVQDDFVVVNGDLLFSPEAVRRVIDLHQKAKPAVTMAAVQVEKPMNYGVLDVAEDGRVKQVVEKPDACQAPTNLANAGIYAFSTEIFSKIRETSASARGEWEIPDAVTLLIKEGKPVLAVEIPAKDWMDIGRPWDLLEANVWVLERMRHGVYGTVEEGAHIVGPVTVAETARIRSGAYVEGPTFVGEGSDVGPNCYVRPCTSVGRKVRIGNACEVKNSILMDEVHVGHLSYVGDSIIGEKCNLAAGTITANYRLDSGVVKMLVKDTVVDTGRRKLGAVLGDNVKTGINALLMPGVKVGNDCWIGPNVMVERDLSAGSKVFLRQVLEKKEQN